MARILLVEDERLIAVDIRARLESAGHTVCAIAADADSALEEVIRHRPDMALMDIRIRGPVDGIEVATRFRDEFGTPVIFLTASADPVNFARAKDARPHGYILKPFQDHSVEIVIDMALERIRLERDLAEQRDLLSAVFDNLDSLILSVDSEDIIRFANEPSVELLGGGFSILGKKLSTVLSLAELERADDGSRRARMLTTEGTAIPVELFEREFDNRGGRVVVLTDVQSRVDYEKALILARQEARALYRERAEFLGNIRHELRTPLNSILGMADLSLSLAEDETQREYLSILSSSTRRLASLLQSVLDFSRIELELDTSSHRETGVRELVEPVLDSVREEAERKGLGMELVKADGCPDRFTVNVSILQQILTHLLSNAVKFSDHGLIRLCFSVDDETQLQISVSDTGPGIGEADRSRVFEPFVQLDYALNRDHGGLGLGLPMSRRLARVLGGTVEFVEGDSAGLTARVTVPISWIRNGAAPTMGAVEVVMNQDSSRGRVHGDQIPLRIEVFELTGTDSGLIDHLRAAGHIVCPATDDLSVESDPRECDALIIVAEGCDDLPDDLLSRARALCVSADTAIYVLTDKGASVYEVAGNACVNVDSVSDLLAALDQHESGGDEGQLSRACGRELRSMLPELRLIELRAADLRGRLPDVLGNLRRALFRLVLASRRHDIDAVNRLTLELIRARTEGVL